MTNEQFLKHKEMVVDSMTQSLNSLSRTITSVGDRIVGELDRFDGTDEDVFQNSILPKIKGLKDGLQYGVDSMQKVEEFIEKLQ
jgi:hypothetical protein